MRRLGDGGRLDGRMFARNVLLARPTSLLLVSSHGSLLRLTIERRGGFGCSSLCVICLHHSVVILQIISDDLCVGLINRRTEGVDHFRDLGIPPSRTQKRRVHRYVIEAMAGAAIGFDSVDTWCLFQLDRFLPSGRRDNRQRSEEAGNEYAHCFLLQATSNVMRAMGESW